MNIEPEEQPERRTLSSLIEKLGEHVIDAETRQSKRGNRYLVLKSKATGVILCQFDLEWVFDKDGNFFTDDTS